jgi:hypothetical protein
MEPPVTERGSSGATSAGERGNGPSQSTAENGGKTALTTVIYEQFARFCQLFDTVRAGCKNRVFIPEHPSVASQKPES